MQAYARKAAADREILGVHVPRQPRTGEIHIRCWPTDSRCILPTGVMLTQVVLCSDGIRRPRLPRLDDKTSVQQDDSRTEDFLEVNDRSCTSIWRAL